MFGPEMEGMLDLGEAEMESIRGGNYVRAATLLLACFGAGFSFGYNVIGPAIFG
jgi:hypothetical protein